MFRAVWNGAVLADSDRTIKVKGNDYFPPCRGVRVERVPVPAEDTPADAGRGHAGRFRARLHRAGAQP
jgi:hypothetical protein